jgi:hypothetical protein
VATILLLVHPDDHFVGRGFMVQGILEEWARAGHRVRIQQGTEGAPPADVAMLHVDLSVVPAPYLELLARYPVTINAGTGDIRKRRFSEHLVTLGDGYEGPVLVKTDLNAGGLPEWRHQQLEIQRGRRPERSARVIAGRYPIFASPAEVPPGVWEEPELVVEKFLPERDERGYYLRTWVFFGDRERCNRVLGQDPIVKAADVIERVPVPVPEALRAWRARLGFDYGKFDFVVRDGEPVLFDVNRTPATAPNLAAALQAGMAHLAGGLAAFLPG